MDWLRNIIGNKGKSDVLEWEKCRRASAVRPRSEGDGVFESWINGKSKCHWNTVEFSVGYKDS